VSSREVSFIKGAVLVPIIERKKALDENTVKDGING
jgi:hypothetical protein